VDRKMSNSFGEIEISLDLVGVALRYSNCVLAG
jgi:hypothetical protein